MKVEQLAVKRGANYMLLLVTILFTACTFLLPNMLQGLDKVLLLLIATLVVECGVLLLPTLLFIRRHGGARGFGLARVNRPSVLFWPLLMGLGAFCVATGINSLMQALWMSLGVRTLDTAQVINAGGGWHFLVSLASIVVIPAVVEELFFRGALLHAWLPQRRTYAILHTALLFSLTHFNPMSLPAYLMLGLLMGTMTALSGSCYPAMILHGTNNLIALLLAYSIDESTTALAEEVLTVPHFITAGILYALWGGILLFFFYRGFKRAVAKQEASSKLLHKAPHAAHHVFLEEPGHGAGEAGEAEETVQKAVQGEADNRNVSPVATAPKNHTVGTGRLCILLAYGVLMLFNILALIDAARPLP